MIGTGPVADFTRAELATLDARAAFPDWPAPCGVPTLNQVLDVVKDMRVLQIEIKQDTPAQHVVPLLLRTIRDRRLDGQVVFISFAPLALAILGRGAPDTAPRTLIGAYDSPARLDRAIALGCTRVNVAPHKTSAAIAAFPDPGPMVGAIPCGRPAASPIPFASANPPRCHSEERSMS